MKYFMSFLISIFIASFFIFSCGSNTTGLKTSVDGKASELNLIFEKTMNAASEGAEIVEKAFEKKDEFKSEIESMDRESGGEWHWFQQHIYWKGYDSAQKDGYTVPLLNYGYLPDDVELSSANWNKSAKILTADDPEFKDVQLDLFVLDKIGFEWMENGNKWMEEGTWYQYLFMPKGYAMAFSFPIDYESAIGPGLTYDMLMPADWFRLGVPEGNPELKNTWEKDAHVGMAGEGWLLTAVSIISPNGNYKGANTMNVFIKKLVKSQIYDMEENILLISKEGALLGMSKAAAGLKLFKDLENFNYLEQLKTNPNFIAEFILTDASQSEDIQNIGKMILAGEKEFESKLGEKMYSFVIGDVEEVGFRIVGFMEK